MARYLKAMQEDPELASNPILQNLRANIDIREGKPSLTQEKYKLPTGETLTEFDKFILELKRPENHTLKVKLALLAMKKLDLSNIKIKERNDQVSKSFDWATKNRTVTSGKTQPKTTIKEAEPFI